MRKSSLTLAIVAFSVVLLNSSCSSKAKEEKDSTDTDTTIVESSEAEPVKTEKPEQPKDDGVLAKLQPTDIKLPSELKGVVEVVNGKNGYIPVTMDENGFPNIAITLKLKKKMDTSSLQNSTGQFWLNGLPQDAQGRTVKVIVPNYDEWRSEDSGGEMIEAFLEGEPQETITLTYSGENNIELFEKDESKISAGKEKTSKACKEVAKFKLFISQGN